MFNLKTIAIVVALIVILISAVLIFTAEPPSEPVAPIIEEPVVEIPAEVTPTTTKSVIGTSVDDRNIESYTFGTGEDNLLFVGGMHGGYEWNSILLAYDMADYLESNPTQIPNNITIHIIPNLNPDGLYTATGLEGKFVASDITDNSMHTSGVGRFNANDVDLNRNFACKWAPESSWRGKTVSAGSAAFSEPEAAALRDYVTTIKPMSVVFWHSQANNVYASECEDGVLPETLSLMRAYSAAGSYGAVPVFDAYPITGDAEGWLASIGIPAITVELEGRTSTEWTRNLAGTKSILQIYGK